MRLFLCLVSLFKSTSLLVTSNHISWCFCSFLLNIPFFVECFLAANPEGYLFLMSRVRDF